MNFLARWGYALGGAGTAFVSTQFGLPVWKGFVISFPTMAFATLTAMAREEVDA